MIFFKESNLTHDPIDLKHDGNFCRSFLRFRLEIGRTVPKALDDRIRNKACYARDRVCEAMVVHRAYGVSQGLMRYHEVMGLARWMMHYEVMGLAR